MLRLFDGWMREFPAAPTVHSGGRGSSRCLGNAAPYKKSSVEEE